jgi:Tol biopolymer transport system component
MAEVMKGRINLDRLSGDTPRWLIQLLERCLDRDPSTRLQSIGEARIALSTNPAESDSVPLTVASATNLNSRPLILLLALFVVIAAGVLWFELRRAAPSAESLSFTLTIPNPANLRQGGGHHLAISPDGKRVVTLGEGPGENMLYTRELSDFEWNPLAGTEDSSVPVFSPDGMWVAFNVNGDIYKVHLNGGAPIQLLDFSGNIQGLGWSDDGYIYGVQSGEIFRVSETGGQKETVYQRNVSRIGSIGAPCVLPGSKAILFDTNAEAGGLGQIHALDLETGKVKDLGLSGSDPRYAHPGALVYAQHGQVLALRFDSDRLEVRSAPVPVFDRVWVEEGSMDLDISRTGTVAYLPDLGDNRVTLQVVDRSGVSKNLIERSLPFRSVSDPRLSPDGTRLVVTANSLQIWMVDLPTETPTRLSENGFYPLWSADGKTVTYGSSRNRDYDLFRVPVDLSQPERLILDKDTNLRTAAMAPDGSLVFREEIPGKGMDLRIWPNEDPKTITPLLEGPDDELAPTISPDGKWMAFVSDLSGSDEVYVCAFPNPSGRVQISSHGGTSPAWSKDGQKIFYVQRDAMVMAKITTASEIRVLSREQLFMGNYLQYRWHRQYDVMPDGKHFLMIHNPLRRNVAVVTNWFPTLKRALADTE